MRYRVETLKTNIYLFSGVVASSDVYRYKEQSSAYTEPENVTVVDQTWTNPGGRLNYLYKVEPDGELTVPPLGMRSAVALGGEFRSILLLIAIVANLHSQIRVPILIPIPPISFP